MDLNELLEAHQRAVMQINGDGTRDGEHAASIALYAARIRDLRDGPGRAGGHPIAMGEDTIIYAGRSGLGEMRPAKAALEIWESEGGALIALHDLLPAGIMISLRPEYRVGPYTYSDLALALAEHARQQRRDGSAKSGPNPVAEREGQD